MTGVSLLWALRSPCNLGCKYCYFGDLDQHRQAMPDQPGALSHLARTDLDLATIAAFVDTLRGSRVRRVFLAGGEPLIWPPILDVISAIKDAGVEVVVCTNGIPLNRPHIVEGLLERGVDAVSVSLDSADAGYNDRWRPARNGKDGHRQVLTGIQALLQARGPQARPRVGIYMVITRQNIDALARTADLAAEMGCDYFVPQPISLEPGNPLHHQLALAPEHASDVTAALQQLFRDPPLRVPAQAYPGQVLSTITADQHGLVRGCFGGRDLFFIEPDGSVWDCPSGLKIAQAAPEGRAARTIRDADASTLFGFSGACTDCQLFSGDCVNMWPLMDFDRFIPAEAST